MSGYIPVLPIDPKAGSEGKNTMYNYVCFLIWPNQPVLLARRIWSKSLLFEHNGNDDTGMDDSGNDIARWEIGINAPREY